MKVYHYDPTTKAFINSSDAMPNHAEGGYFLPSHSTFKPVGAIPVGMSAIFDIDKQEWILMKNYIGKMIYNKKTQQATVVTTFGDIDKDYTLDEPLKEECYWDEKQNKWVIDVVKQTQKKLEEIRKQRNELLDFIDTKKCNSERWEDMTEEQKRAWRIYKQQLRDLPENVDVNNPVWPKMPDETN